MKPYAFIGALWMVLFTPAAFAGQVTKVDGKTAYISGSTAWVAFHIRTREVWRAIESLKKLSQEMGIPPGGSVEFDDVAAHFAAQNCVEALKLPEDMNDFYLVDILSGTKAMMVTIHGRSTLYSLCEMPGGEDMDAELRLRAKYINVSELPAPLRPRATHRVKVGKVVGRKGE